MCLAIPGRILEMSREQGSLIGKVSFGGVVKEINFELVPEVIPGDYVLVHVGVAISVINEMEAERTFEYLKEIGELDLGRISKEQ